MTAIDASVGSGEGALKRYALRPLLALLKVVVGILFCLTPLTAVLVLGWLMRFMRREMVRTWGRVLKVEHFPNEYSRLPNWVFGQNLVKGSLFHKAAGSFFENIKYGLGALFSLGLAAFLYGVFLAPFWWAGWNNSFNKGYEQAAIGPGLSIIGIALFILVMSYLPLATAHQASTGRWRGFFDHKSVLAVINASRLSWLWLAVLWFFAALPFLGLRALPILIGIYHPDFFDQAATSIEKFKGTYFFWGTVYLFLAIVVLRRSAARIYAKAALKLAQKGQSNFTVSDWQKGVIEHMGGARGAAHHNSGAVIKVLGRGATIVVSGAGAVIWFGLYFQILFGQFLNHSWSLWVQHPLILLPWLVPPGAH